MKDSSSVGGESFFMNPFTRERTAGAAKVSFAPTTCLVTS